MKLWLYKIEIARYGIHTTSFLGNNQCLSGDAIHQAFYKKKRKSNIDNFLPKPNCYI